MSVIDIGKARVRMCPRKYVRIGRDLRVPGDVFEVKEAQAVNLVAAGLAERVADEEPAPVRRKSKSVLASSSA